jgi:hypothetical protein
MARLTRSGLSSSEQAPFPAPSYAGSQLRKEVTVLSTLIVVLVVLWLLGMVTSYTMGGLLHILLVVAVVIVLLRIIQGRNPIEG